MYRKPARRRLFSRRGDRRGVALIEAAFILPPFLSLLFLIIEIGIYFVLQSSLDLGVLTEAETLRTGMAAGRSFARPAAAAVKLAIARNGGAVMLVANLAVDLRLLSTLSAANTPVADGTYEWVGSSGCGSGSILILRAQTTMPFLPGASVLTLISTSIIRCPPY